MSSRKVFSQDDLEFVSDKRISVVTRDNEKYQPILILLLTLILTLTMIVMLFKLLVFAVLLYMLVYTNIRKILIGKRNVVLVQVKKKIKVIKNKKKR